MLSPSKNSSNQPDNDTNDRYHQRNVDNRAPTKNEQT
jgi:hypothetical protein